MGSGPAVVTFAAAVVAWYMQARFRQAGEGLIPALASLPLGFAVGTISGMAFRRGITAFVIASVATICLALPLIELALENVVQAAGILIVAARVANDFLGVAARLDARRPSPRAMATARSKSGRCDRGSFSLPHRIPRVECAQRRPDRSA